MLSSRRCVHIVRRRWSGARLGLAPLHHPTSAAAAPHHHLHRYRRMQPALPSPYSPAAPTKSRITCLATRICAAASTITATTSSSSCGGSSGGGSSRSYVALVYYRCSVDAAATTTASTTASGDSTSGGSSANADGVGAEGVGATGKYGDSRLHEAVSMDAKMGRRGSTGGMMEGRKPQPSSRPLATHEAAERR